MNGKKVLVALLLILTVIIGIAAIYFATTLKPKVTISPTPTPLVFTKAPTPTDQEFDLTPTISPTVNPSVSPSINPTLSITPDIGKLTCGQPCDKGTCMDGYNCINVNNTKKCVSNNCVTLQNGSYIPNGSCEADLCTISNEITILKTSTISCVSGQDTRKISFSIKLTNPVAITNRRLDVSVVDLLNTNLKDSYIVTSSISNGGQLSSGQLKWQGLTLDASGGSIVLHYDAIVPNADNGKSFSNVVSVLEGGVQKNSYNFVYTVNILPCTALITDEVDRVLVGVILLIFGIFIYRMDWHYSIGQYFWKNGGKRMYKEGTTLNSIFKRLSKNIYLDITQRGNKKFERKTIQDREKNKL